MMKISPIIFLLSLTVLFSCFSQVPENIGLVTIEDDNNYDGFELVEIDSNQLFVLAEHWHNIQSVPMATLKTLKYLHKHANVRILAIEQGTSAAMMINSFLETGDTIRLREIARNTMFWGQENWRFFQDLRSFNLTLPENDRVYVSSIDIEYKMESAIFVINEMIADRSIPKELKSTVGAFHELFESKRSHREQFQGLSAMFYYDKELVESLVLSTINEIEQKQELYTDFFGEDFVLFATMILEMDDGLTFDYTNPNYNYKFRDRLIYRNFISLIEENPEVGVLCVIGMRHATKNSSIYKLDNLSFSPLYQKVSIIKVSALYNKILTSSDLKRFNYNYPNILRENPATLIKHTNEDAALRSSKLFDYTLFVNQSGTLTPFPNVYKSEYGK
ncbi:MAG: hypothetical protein HRT61_01935 [Ekhidna sp.]|nr:hypothetical protein [Ekhidna sp.]